MHSRALVMLVVLIATAPLRAEEPFKRQWESIQHSGPILAIAFSPDGTFLAVGCRRDYEAPDDPGEVVIWSVKSREKVITLDGHGGTWAVAFSPDGKVLATASADKKVRLWDLATKKELAVIKEFPRAASQLAFSPDGKTLAGISSGDGEKTPSQVVLWDVVLQKARATLDTKAEDAWSLAFSPDGRLLAVGTAQYDKKKNVWTRGHVWVWDPALAVLKKSVEFSESRVQALAFSPDGKTLATGSDTRTVPTEFREYSGVTGDGDGVVKLWDVTTWKVHAEAKVEITSVTSLAFCPDGKTLAYATGSIRRDLAGGLGTTSHNEVILLDAMNLKKIGKLPWHDGVPVEGMAFCPVGRVLATGDHYRIKLWEIAERR